MDSTSGTRQGAADIDVLDPGAAADIMAAAGRDTDREQGSSTGVDGPTRDVAPQSTIGERLRALDQNAIATALATDGFYRATDVVAPAVLDSLRAAVNGLVEKFGSRPFSVIMPGTVADAFAAIVNDATFAGVMREQAVRALDTENVRNSALHNVLRVVISEKGDAEHVFEPHYDASVITLLVPIYIPDGTPEEAGDFVCIPNHRSYRRSVFVNFIEKTVRQGSLARRWFGNRARAHHQSLRIVKLVPGDAYLFNGYRTYHANFSNAAGTRRATLLFHFGDPHLNSVITRATLWLQRRRERRVLGRRVPT